MFNLKIVCSVVIFVLPALLIHAQDSSLNFMSFHKGLFYDYPRNSVNCHLNMYDGNAVREVEMGSKDTVFWKISWLDDCTFSLTFNKGWREMPDEIRTFLDKHILVFKIENIGADYYTYSAYKDKVSKKAMLQDTMWTHEKVNFTGNALLQWVPASYAKKNHFSDTSKYALLYVYRPGKVTNMLASYPVSFNDMPLCLATNNTGYVFKVFKEGNYELSSKLYKDIAKTTVDIKFGQTYYVKSMIHWGISSRLYNFKLEMAVMKPEDGKTEFGEVNVR